MVINFVHAIEEKGQTQVNGETTEEGTSIRCQIRSCQKICQSCPKIYQEKICSEADSIETQGKEAKQGFREFRN